MTPLFINSSPNTQRDDFFEALKVFLNPFSWNKGNSVEKFEKEIEGYFEGEIKSVAFDSARTSFYQLLEELDIKEGDEVIVPAFTCTVIVNPILWVGAKPVYVDIDPISLNMDLQEMEKKITKNTKIILAQHTFGVPLEMEKVMSIAKEKGIIVVEDCAHSLGVRYKGKLLGTWGDAAVITFGITKVISGSRGGMALVKNKTLYENLKKRQKALPSFPLSKTIKFLLNPIIWYLIPPVYYLGFKKFTVGKFIILILQKTGIIGIDNIVEPVEERGEKPEWYPTKMSPALAPLASYQLKKLSEYNNHRSEIAKIYSENLYTPHFSGSLNLRYPLYVKDKRMAMESFRKMRIILGDWYKAILHIPEKYYSNLMYKKGMCPNAEYATEYLVNLPTNIKVTKEHALFISEKAKEYVDTEFYASNR